MSAGGQTQLPPIAKTWSSARYAGADPASIPPVGRKCTVGATARNAERARTPPAASAWKNFTSPNPASAARISSVAVATPGTNGMDRSAVKSAALDPGLTAKAAPAAMTSSSWAFDTTVPAPTTAPPTVERTASIADIAPGVRSAISITGIP